MAERPLLVLGTGNRKKGREMADLLGPRRTGAVRTLADFPAAIQVAEDGETFAANAAKKATQQARHLGRWVLADDSGLMVDPARQRRGRAFRPLFRPGGNGRLEQRKTAGRLAGVLSDCLSHSI